MELRTYLHALWQVKYAVVLGVAGAGVAAFLLSSAMPKMYTAEARIVVTAGLGTAEGGTDEVQMAPRVGQTYAVLATTRPVLDDVVKRANLPYDATELQKRIVVTANLDTPFVFITMTDSDANRAAAAANATADTLVRLATTTETPTRPQTAILAIVERASVPIDPSAPRVSFITVMAVVAALVGALVLVALITTMRSGGPSRSMEASPG